MADRNLRQRVSLDKQGILLPVERTALTAPVKPLEQNPPRFHQEVLYRPEIKRHTVILDVPPQFRAEYCPDVLQRKLTAD